ncbi:hypothetical protein KUTeg_005352 [Tegillarca granosa]|uniref:L-xylulose reductase n=1 Tax=Tegillarca granosa TaxID=220873 RepID=A0ABQ9FJG6_TEGGR|nr:hypothetical protein KUTeg_005352 [Tegillarca granosa]
MAAYDFKGKRALVTGGSRGIGKAIVKALVEAGAEVFAVAKTQANLDKLKSEIPSVNIIAVDLADWETTRQAVEKVGNIDLLVNNAAALDQARDMAAFVDVTKASLDKSLDVNLKAAFNVSQIVVRDMIKRSCGGAIINMSSIAGLRPFTGMSPYNISKAGMDMMTKVMALELGPHNIRVNTISPTVVNTETVIEHFEQMKIIPEIQTKIQDSIKRHPLGKFTEMSDVVNATMFLLSDKASMITGTILPVDSGYLVS